MKYGLEICDPPGNSKYMNIINKKFLRITYFSTTVKIS